MIIGEMPSGQAERIPPKSVLIADKRESAAKSCSTSSLRHFLSGGVTYGGRQDCYLPGTYLQLADKQRADGVENGQNHYPHVGENSKPHIGDSKGAQYQADQLYTDGKDDILVDNPQAFA